MCPTIDEFASVSAAQWNSAYYSAMAVASNAIEAAQKRAQSISVPIPIRLWQFERSLRNVVDIIENPSKASAAEEKSALTIDVSKVADQIDSLVQALEDSYKAFKRAGYTNRTLTAGSLDSIRRHTEVVQDFAERIRLIIDPRTDGIFERAREARRTNGTVPMSSVF